MKRIAFLSFDWDYEIITRYYLGMQAYLQDRDDLQLVIFSAFGHYYAKHDPEAGSFEVFTLCDLGEYDGFLIQGNRTWPPSLRQEYVDKIRAQGKPVISINYELEGASYVGTDNYEAMRGLVRQVIEDRHLTRTLFVNGLATSSEAQDRARAYRDVCTELGVPDARFVQANWQIEEGEATARQLLQHIDDLPEVVFCCNDDLAVGLQEALQAAGVKVPDDVMVTGFDNREISLRTSPRITTIDRDYFTIGQTAIRTLEQVMAGEELPQRVFSPVRYILAGSCGYPTAYETDIISDIYTLDNSLKQFYEVLKQFQSQVLSADSLETILSDCEQFAAFINCPNVYLCVNDKYLRLDADRSALSYGPVSHLMAKRGSTITRPCDMKHIYTTFLSNRLLPPEVPMDKPVYTVLPLRHNETCIGALVTEGVSPIMQHGFLTFFLTLLSVSIESVQKKKQLQAANSRLDNLYVHDELTGLFNRFGLDRFGGIAYEHLLRDFKVAYFIFVDIDNMKLINDVCGHDMGDCAIRDTADIIRRAMRGENAFAMRYGGDEFLLICRRDLIPKLQGELALLKSSSQYPYDLSLSMGSYMVEADDHYAMMDAIKLADARMYEIKRARKAEQEGIW